MVHTLDRASLKAQCRELLHTAQVSPKGLTALYCGLSLVLNLVDYAAGSFASNGGPELLSLFASVFTMLAGWILATGFALYCMGIRQREIMDYGTLFDGFSFTGKIIALNFVMNFFICLWSMLFVIPGVIAYYRSRFALYGMWSLAVSLFFLPNYQCVNLDCFDAAKAAVSGGQTFRQTDSPDDLGGF